MQNKFRPLGQATLLALLTCSSVGFSQTTLQDVQVLLNTNCTFSSCHDATSPAAGLNLSGSATEIYDALVNQTPTNPAAAGKGYKRVEPGYPENSFLLHKLGRDSWDASYDLGPGEGNSMPTTGSLTSAEIELVRQWIIYGAPATTQVVDPVVLNDFYGGMGMATVPVPTPPAEGQGLQIRMGPFYLAPGEEREYFYKRAINSGAPKEVTRTEVFFNEVSHHFILYRFESAATAGGYRAGLREISEPGGAPDADVGIVAAWQDAYDIPLPAGTAYFWGTEEILDLNFHLYNASMDSIMQCDVYVNIYTRPRDASQPTVEMFSQIIPIDALEAFSGGEVGESLIIPGDGAVYEFTDDLFFPIPTAPTWHLWYLSSHTHSRGVDYDIYNRATGEQIFEGFYNIDYTFDQGFYDWEHPPVRIFEPLYPVSMGLTGGLRHTAKYVNNTGSTIFWGDRTTDEMMLFFIQYTNEPIPDLTAIDNPASPLSRSVELYPNPAQDQSVLRFEVPAAGQVSVEIFNALGQLVSSVEQQLLPAGAHQTQLDVSNLESGMYNVVLQFEGERVISKLVKLD
jgi:hypothetical protein